MQNGWWSTEREPSVVVPQTLTFLPIKLWKWRNKKQQHNSTYVHRSHPMLKHNTSSAGSNTQRREAPIGMCNSRSFCTATRLGPHEQHEIPSQHHTFSLTMLTSANYHADQDRGFRDRFCGVGRCFVENAVDYLLHLVGGENGRKLC